MMFKDRIFRFIFFAALVMTIAGPIVMTYVVLPMYMDTLNRNVEDEARRVAAHLSSMLAEEHIRMDRDSLQKHFAHHVSSMQKDLKFMKLKIMDLSGTVLYSTDTSETGGVYKNEFLSEVMENRSTHSHFVRSGESSYEGKVFRADVIETYAPIIIQDRMAGVFEFYYDVTDKKKHLDNTLVYALAGFLSIMGGFLFIVTIVFYWLDRSVRREYDQVLKDRYSTPVYPLMVIIASLFSAELVVMTVLSLWPVKQIYKSLVDASLLILLITPVLYFFIVRPLMSHLAVRRRAEEDLRSSHELNTAVLENMHEAIAVINASDFSILSANNAFAETYGIEEEEIVTRPCFDLIRKSMRYKENELCPMQQTLLSGKSSSAEVESTDEHGEKRTYTVTVIPLRKADGEIEKIVHITSDVTEQREYEETLIRAKRLAEEASEAKTRFLANMSHEIRTPMNGIIGMIDLALGTGLNDEQKEYLFLAERSANFLLGILNNALDVSRIEAGQVRVHNSEFDLHGVFRDLKNIMFPEAEEKGVKLALVISRDVPDMVIGDEGKFKQVLFNLMGNAVKFTHKGRITVYADLVSPQTGGNDSIRLRCTVADTGIGISAEKIERIFDSFYQGDSSLTKRFSGTGLGLVISRELVRLMGGEINVESEEKVGSTFSFEVNLKGVEGGGTLDKNKKGRRAMIGQRETTGKDQVPEPGSPRLLVAEDDPLSRRLIDIVLTRKGYDFKTVKNGKEAIDALSAEMYNLVLMDIRMPDMDGLEAVRIIRDKTSSVLDHDVPVVAVTAHAIKGSEEDCFEAGMNAFLKKPLKADELIDTVDKLIVAARRKCRIY